MGLACSNIRLLTLTARKSDCEYGISVNSLEKMALTREQSNLTREYSSRLQSKRVAYYQDGQYRDVDYNYLMGDGVYHHITTGSVPLKDDNSMILTDYKGQVVMSDIYAKTILSVLGNSAMSADGRGGTFSYDKIPAMISKLIPCTTAEEIQTIIDGKDFESSFEANELQSITGDATGSTVTVDNSKQKFELYQKYVDFYYPIFSAAAANGWTKEYNNDMKTNDKYVTDAITTGTFQLAQVNEEGNYKPDANLTYFATAGLVETRIDSSAREDITAWYNAEKERISEKESWLDIENQDLSTELEAINQEIQSVKSFIEDATSSVFDWGGK